MTLRFAVMYDAHPATWMRILLVSLWRLTGDMVVSRIDAAVRAGATRDRAEFMFPSSLFEFDMDRMHPRAAPLTVGVTAMNELQPYLFTTTDETGQAVGDLLYTRVLLSIPRGTEYTRPPRWVWRRRQDPHTYIDHDVGRWEQENPAVMDDDLEPVRRTEAPDSEEESNGGATVPTVLRNSDEEMS